MFERRPKLAIAVPTNVNGKDRIEFNAARVYGPVLYPFLATNWRFTWPLKGNKNGLVTPFVISKYYGPQD